MQKEKDEFERAQTEATTQIQTQLDAAMKQIRNLIQKSEDMDEELKESKKTNEGKIILIHSCFLNCSLWTIFVSSQIDCREKKQRTWETDTRTSRDDNQLR